MKTKSIYNTSYNILNKTGNVINYICLTLACLAGIGMFGCLIWGVFTRKVLGYQAIWTEELARFCLIWVTMTGCSVAWKNNTMTRFRVVIDRVPEGARRILEVVVTLLVVAYLVLFLFSGNAAMVVFKITKASVLKIPLSWVASGLYVGACAMIYHSIPRLMEQVKSVVDYYKEKPETKGEVQI